MAVMHEIDYKIFGDDMQFVEVGAGSRTKPRVAEAGGMMSWTTASRWKRSSATARSSRAGSSAR